MDAVVVIVVPVADVAVVVVVADVDVVGVVLRTVVKPRDCSVEVVEETVLLLVIVVFSSRVATVLASVVELL